MNLKDWKELKEALEKISPKRRLFYLKELKKNEKNKEILEDIKKLIEKTEIEAREEKDWKREGTLPQESFFPETEAENISAPAPTTRQLRETVAIETTSSPLETLIAETPIEIPKDQKLNYGPSVKYGPIQQYEKAEYSPVSEASPSLETREALVEERLEEMKYARSPESERIVKESQETSHYSRHKKEEKR